MEIFNVKKKEIDQVMKKEEVKSTNPLKINKGKRKQKDIIMKLIDNLPNHLKDKKEYLLSLKEEKKKEYLLSLYQVQEIWTTCYRLQKRRKSQERKRQERKDKNEKETR